MNNDDISDEQFDAFLRGEDALSRRLQGLTQPASSSKLDAAILGYVKAGLAQEAQAARPAAANDPVIEGAPPRLAPGLGRRWRIPAGIAAGVLAGVLGHQVYQDGGARMEEGMAAAPAAPVAAEMAPAPAVRVAPRAPAPAPVELAAAAPQERQRVDITGSSIRQKSAEASSPVMVSPRDSYGVASKPSTQGYNSDNPVSEMPIPPVAAAPRPMPAPAPPPVVVADARDEAAPSYARMARPSAAAREAKNSLEELKPASPEAHEKRARDWLSVIDALLKAKLNKEALVEWTRFRAAYPDYPVPAETRDRITAIKP